MGEEDTQHIPNRKLFSYKKPNSVFCDNMNGIGTHWRNSQPEKDKYSHSYVETKILSHRNEEQSRDIVTN